MCADGCTEESAIVPGFSKAGTHDGFACYGYDGAGSLKCGVSADDCSTLGGTSYAPGHTYQGCCMCDENCDHTAETADSCTYTATVVASPTPPPNPPSPPPSPSFPPAVGDSGNYMVVTSKLTISGDLSDYSDRTWAAIASKVAIACAVHESDITVTAEAGSVVVTIEIKTAGSGVDKVTTAMETHMATASSAQSFLGTSVLGYYASVESVEPVTSAEVGLSTGALIGIIVGSVAGVIIIGGGAYMYMKKKKKAAAPAGKGAASDSA